ncbi:MAG TPA: indolepyruvate ferredoxin oxidoreductase subunit alpha [Humidesulfovibrio sp.]|uniref:indolepyruvate ferredoxin oxidoreductase subunit alpha n=1 Tax=Humidesulfovibrio sp. TaxID=2910988 RepID=UPI002BDFC8D5|nr:indolepyruvate ferredoxin oxidoreductase subunit alpha [Humidesulfovibrio sp.]HWR05047.1 indolepyruvate ferredoxin oxidoreductase subunit alpha [Humidesulfovibrio sp.]
MAHPLLAGAPGSTHLFLGNEAIVRGAIEAGIQFVSCYPGTPSSEVPDTFFRLSPEGSYTFEYSVNEKVALEVAGGATLAGALSMVTMKHVGVNVAADPLLTLTYVGSPGGFMLLSADDPGCHSSQNEQDNRIYARIAGMPCLEPATAQEAKDMTREALTMSRSLGAPVLLRTTTRVNHLRGPVTLSEPTVLPAPAGFQKNPSKFVPIPAFARPMHLRLLETLEKARALAETSPYNVVSGSGSVGVIASGISRAYLADALTEADLAGQNVKVLDLGFSYPLPERLITTFMHGLSTLLILEELEPVLENEIRALAQKLGMRLTILGKVPGPMPRFGEFDVAMVASALREVLGLPAPAQLACSCGTDPVVALPNRPPNLCAGCPHRATYVAVRKVFGDTAVYSSDIGCYTLGILPPLKAADFLLCMGSSISAGCGAAKAAGQTVVGFIGDSTFFHSGITGLVNAVFNRHDILVVILDNRTTAMTGHQPNPGVDKTTLGDNPSMVAIEPLVRGIGIEHIRTVNPLNQKATLKAIEELKALSGVRVLIAVEPCPLFARRAYGVKRTQVAYVAADCAEAAKDGSCGDCLNTLACPAFYLEDGKMAIDPILCAGCMLCLQVCKNIKARKGDAK